MGRLEGKVAVITGGARGQGAAEARLFRAEGARVFITDVLTDLGEVTAAGCGATFLPHDVTDPQRWEAIVQGVLDEAGHIDVLINNAGIFNWENMCETPLAMWNRIIGVNQTGVFLGMQAVAPAMKAQRSGSIINISSIGGLRGASQSFAYSTTKWAVRGMTKGAARELGPFNVRVNSIHPGLIDTEMVASLPKEHMVGMIPLGRMAAPEEVANLALWLASDESLFANGGEFTLDGGQTA